LSGSEKADFAGQNGPAIAINIGHSYCPVVWGVSTSDFSFDLQPNSNRAVALLNIDLALACPKTTDAAIVFRVARPGISVPAIAPRPGSQR
jgi:hypothetical protein